MPRPFQPANIDQAIQLYLSGEPMEKIRTTTGMAPNTVHKHLRLRGIPSRRVYDLPVEQIARQYLAGASELALSKQYGVSRTTITARLRSAGVERRNMSEAGAVRASLMEPGQRAAQAAAAHRVTRLRRTPEIQKFRRALKLESEATLRSDGEAAMHGWLTERGESPVVERAIGPYNVDLAVLPVAVEILGGGFHSAKASHAERTPYILDAGWHLVMVWNYEGRSALTPQAADYVVTFAQKVRRNPPATCQYRVISGDGEHLATAGRENNEFPLEPPPRGAVRMRT